MCKNKFMTIEERKIIENSINSNISYSKIADKLNRSTSTISREIKKNSISINKMALFRNFNNCVNRFSCRYKSKRGFIKCVDGHKSNSLSTNVCPYFEEEICTKRFKYPYVCNGCNKLNKCTLKKTIYSAAKAHEIATNRISESRQGITLTPKELVEIDQILIDLIKNKKQSPAVIVANNPDSFNISSRTVYNYIDKQILTVKNIDLPKKVKYKKRRKSINHKIDTKCRTNRTYIDFCNYINNNPNTSIVEIDTVEGCKGGKCLLTVYFRNCGLQLAFLRNHNNSKTVIDVFNDFYQKLGPDNFTNLFQLILTDNGTEFSNPEAIENNYVFEDNKIIKEETRTKLYYCDPSNPSQKGACERNHEFIRKIVPKGTTFDNLEQNSIDNFMNHINSYKRKKINNQSPTELFIFIYGVNIANTLGIKYIKPNDINLTPTIL
jgi:IS30 family transposase